jgi:hypothetical protein
VEKCEAETAAHSRRKFRFKNKLMSLDGSIIEPNKLLTMVPHAIREE